MTLKKKTPTPQFAAEVHDPVSTSKDEDAKGSEGNVTVLCKQACIIC